MSIYTTLGSTGMTRWKALTFHSSNKDSAPWFVEVKHFLHKLMQASRDGQSVTSSLLWSLINAFVQRCCTRLTSKISCISFTLIHTSFSRRIKSTLITVIFTCGDIRYTLLSLNNLCKYILIYTYLKNTSPFLVRQRSKGDRQAMDSYEFT